MLFGRGSLIPKRNKLLTKLDRLEQEYVVSFEMFLNTLPAEDVIAGVLTLKATDNDYNNKDGDRIPMVFIRNQLLEFRSSVNGNFNYDSRKSDLKVVTHKWYHIQISQT